MANYYLVGGELKHYGVLGMKWGRRKNNNSSSNVGIKKNTRSTNNRIKLNKTEKNALKTAGVLAGVSAVQTVGNYKRAQKALDLMGYGDKILVKDVVKKGAVAAGRAAVIGAMAYVGTKKAYDYVKERYNESQEEYKR